VPTWIVKLAQLRELLNCCILTHTVKFAFTKQNDSVPTKPGRLVALVHVVNRSVTVQNEKANLHL